MARIYFKEKSRWQVKDVDMWEVYMGRVEIRELRKVLIPLKVKFGFIRNGTKWFKFRLRYTASGVIDQVNYIDMFIAPADLRLFLTLSE